MQEITTKPSLLRRPSKGELLFLGLLVAFFGITGGLSGHNLLFAPFDWFHQSVSAQFTEKPYDGDGVVITINDETFATLGRNSWTKADLAKVITAAARSKPRTIVIARQYFGNDSEKDAAQLRQALIETSLPVYWEVPLNEAEMIDLTFSDPNRVAGDYTERSDQLDQGVRGLVKPVAMVLIPTPMGAPLESWYSVPVDGDLLPSAAQVLSKGAAPLSNRFNVDLGYDPASIPTLNAAQIVAGDFDAIDLKGKSVIISFMDNLARDTLATPGNPYTSRGVANLMAAQTLNRGPPVNIGWFPAFLVGLAGVFAWTFIRRPLGRWFAMGSFALLLVSTALLEPELIFQFTSQGVFLIVILAFGKVWMRGREIVKTYRSAAETKSRFLAQASHDLRQPIHAIGLLSERLSQTGLSADQSEIVSKITWSVDNASRMFRTLLDVAAIESGTLQKHIGPVSVNELLAEIDGQNGLVAEQTGVDLRLVPCDLVIKTDRALIGTMLQNLVSNAIKYSPGGKVVVGCRRQGARAALYVIDNGKGISRSDLKHVQTEFYRASNKSSLATDNKGLGLAIVNRLVRMLDLEFVLSSQEGKGTVTSIKGLRTVDTTRESSEEPKVRRLPLSGLRVVLADDDVETLKSTARLLEQWGCAVTSFGHFPTELPECDIFLSDFDFGNGDTLAGRHEELKRVKSSRKRLIIVSGHPSDVIRDSLPNIPDLVLSKPVRAAELRSAIMSLRVGER
ncbi:CHASE2 domain-containing protein [Erythrobacter insulae]|uniref:histidine kinase n=1 Tax=Erythrobacter insulae TaxID=2584124 RepID=A0A547PAX4_9SPHN|nr:ATP-binding protein [Erythrobacter insulae]TRD11280.1 CHASE2 domain-containing protein [Erythrobacter insulae]